MIVKILFYKKTHYMCIIYYFCNVLLTKNNGNT